jgi:hypothetical protein
MVALTAYFDASGKPDAGYELVVSGFISTAKKWQRFEEKWQRLLDKEGLPYFHIKEFAPPTQAWCRECSTPTSSAHFVLPGQCCRCSGSRPLDAL